MVVSNYFVPDHGSVVSAVVGDVLLVIMLLAMML